MSLAFEAIGHIQSCFREKFGIPRQSGLAPSAQAILQLKPEFALPGMLDGLQAFSHLWLIFVFHDCLNQGWQPKVRPPRLGGNQRLGVYATRSNFRPNPIGLSAVQLLQVDVAQRQLLLGGVDLLDGSPILDIKPYIPYADSLTYAQAGFAQQAPVSSLQIGWTDRALSQAQALLADYPKLISLTEQVLSQDPRPAYHQDPQRIYGLRLWDLNIRWQASDQQIEVLSIDWLSPNPATATKPQPPF